MSSKVSDEIDSPVEIELLSTLAVTREETHTLVGTNYWNKIPFSFIGETHYVAHIVGTTGEQGQDKL